jgi:DNA-binding SARP family transcriptional activator
VATLRLCVLGTPHFEVDGRRAALPVAKSVALLGCLALAQHQEPRERLMALLWPESEAEAARKNLRNTLWTIRRALGERAVVAEGDGLGLAATVWVDVREFETAAGALSFEATSLEAAAELYRGPLLNGLYLPDAPEFETWLTAGRERLAQTYLHVLAALAAVHRSAGNWEGVIRAAQSALRVDDLQEPMHQALMEAFAQLGDRAEAQRQYERLRQALALELGVEPLPETDALRAALRSPEWRARPGPPKAATVAVRRQPVMGDAARAPFIGREAELAQLTPELERAASGQARVVAISGELGIGKSRLWQEWSAGVEASLTVLQARCLETTQGLPYGPLADLFNGDGVARRLFQASSPVPALWLAEVARLLPELRLGLPDLPATPNLPPDQERRQLFEALTQCLLALAGRPLVVFVDDLHWADRATLDWLAYLVRRLQAKPLLLVVAYRQEDATEPLTDLLGGWTRDGVARRLRLRRLNDADAIGLVASLGRDANQPAEWAGEVVPRSGGNPYFIIELCQAGPGAVPAALAELVRARLGRLPGAAQQVLQAAAVLEPGLDFSTLRRVSGRGEEEMLDALDVLIQAGVLVERGGPYEFPHPLVAAVVRAGLSGARRNFLHRRAAEALEESQATPIMRRGPEFVAQSAAQLAGRLAQHWEQAGDKARAADYAEAAGTHALGLAAYVEAVAFYRRSATLKPTADRWLGLGRALYRNGEFAEARSVLNTAREGYAVRGEHDGAAWASATLFDLELRAGQFGEVLRLAEADQSYLDPGTDPEAQALIHHIIGAAMLHGHQPTAEAERHFRLSAALAATNGLAEVAARTHIGLANARAQRGDLEGALADYGEAIRLAQEAGDLFHETLGHNNYAYHALLRCDLRAAHEHIAAGLALAEARGLQVLGQWLYSTRGQVALAEGKWDEAEAWFERGLSEVERYGNSEMMANYYINQGRVARGRGDLAEAVRRLEAAGAAAPAAHVQSEIDLWLAEVYRELGNEAAAGAALRRAEASLAGSDQGRLEEWAGRLKKGA